MVRKYRGRVAEARPDIARMLRVAAERDAHTRRLWAEAIKRGHSCHWVERRLAEIFRAT